MSAPLPPPPDFLRMAMAAQEERRRQQQDMLQQLAMQREQQDRIAAGQERDFHTAMDFAEKGVPLNTIFQNVPNLPIAKAELVKAIAKKKKEDAAQAEGETEAAGASTKLAQLVGNARGDVSQIDPGMLDQLKIQLLQGGTSSPESKINEMVALARSNEAARIRGDKEQITQESQLAGARASAVQRVGFSGPGGEQVSALSGLMAAQRAGLVPEGTVAKAYARIEQDIGPASAAKVRSDALTTASSDYAKLLERRTSVNQGKAGNVQKYEDLKETLIQDYGPEQVSKTGDAWLRLFANGDAAEDAYAKALGELRLVRVTSPTDAQQFINLREGQLELRGSFDTMQSSFSALRSAVQEGRAPGVGPGSPTFMQDLRTFFGKGSPEAEAYRSSMFQFVTALLKAKQGSRPSDFDMKIYLAQAPTLQEVLSGTAEAKLDVLRQSLDTSVLANTRSPFAGQVQAKKKIPLDSAGRRAVGNVQILMDKMEKDPNSITDDDLINAFGPSLDNWQAGQGRAYQMRQPGVVGDNVQDAFRAVVGGAGGNRR